MVVIIKKIQKGARYRGRIYLSLLILSNNDNSYESTIFYTRNYRNN
jgi:hypothetical protein